MKQRVLTAILAVAFAFTSIAATAQQTTNIEASVKQIAKEFDNAKGVDCIVLEQGMGLGMIKGLFKSKFGNAFMKDVTSMVIIDYSKASAEICNSIRSKIESTAEHLQVFTLGKEEVKEDQYVRAYATVNGATTITDFMIITEDSEKKTFLFMGGVLNVDKMELNL